MFLIRRSVAYKQKKGVFYLINFKLKYFIFYTSDIKKCLSKNPDPFNLTFVLFFIQRSDTFYCWEHYYVFFLHQNTITSLIGFILLYYPSKIKKEVSASKTQMQGIVWHYSYFSSLDIYRRPGRSLTGFIFLELFERRLRCPSPDKISIYITNFQTVSKHNDKGSMIMTGTIQYVLYRMCLIWP